MPETLQLANPTPLTTLTEDEILFRDNVRQFAEDKIRPLAKEMDEKAVFDHSLIDQFFQLGLMGIEIPEQYGGAGGKFFEAILAVEDCSRADASPELSSTCRTRWSRMRFCAGPLKTRKNVTCPRWQRTRWAPMR